MIPRKHHLESVILKRRLELLTLCDELIMRGVTIEDYETREIQHIFSQFSDVRDIEDLIASLEKVYRTKSKK